MLKRWAAPKTARGAMAQPYECSIIRLNSAAILGSASAEGQRIAVQRIVNEWLGTRPDGQPVTASIGVAERIADSAQDWPALIELADARMYQAKMSGKARGIIGADEVIVPNITPHGAPQSSTDR